MPNPVSTWMHTLRWMPTTQLAALARDRVRRRLEDPARFARRTPPPEPVLRHVPEPQAWSAPDQDAAALRAGRFRFLNRDRDVGWPPDWEAPGAPLLWTYNLHYFESLASLDFESGRELILDWIARHPLRRGAAGWEPYPTSLRLQAWCGWLYGRHRERLQGDAALRARVWPSLWLQAEWLGAHVEHHLRANHLFENAAALALCGALFTGPGERWLRRGLALLDRELREQILADGVHYERSPLYHARLVGVMRQLDASGAPEIARRVSNRLLRMRAALACLSHPDGEIALLNDSAFGIAEAPASLGAVPEDGSFALEEAGYYGARRAGHYLVCDAGPIGPDYQPGHAHGDLLSFELSLDGQRVVVDAGVHGYDGDALRAWCRSTRAHNTVEIEGVDQCEFWSTFRVARRARPRDVRWSGDADGFELSAWHDGYERLPGRPRHARRFRWQTSGVLEVRDRVTAQRPVRSVSRLHLHPDCVVEETGERSVRVVHPRGAFRVVFEGEGALRVEASTWCPEFGLRRESRALAFESAGAETETCFRIERTGAGRTGGAEG